MNIPSTLVNIPVWFLLDTLLLLAIGLNMIASVMSTLARKNLNHATRRLTDLRASPFYTCVMNGHDLALETKVLDSQEPPLFVMTHLLKWTCRREGCDFSHISTLRETLNAPGVQEIEARWLEEPPGHPE